MGEGGAAGNGARADARVGLLGRGIGLSWARPLTLGGKETCLPARSQASGGVEAGGACGGGKRGRGEAPGLSLKADSKFEVVLAWVRTHVHK